MEPKISFKKISSDGDFLGLEINVSDGFSLFSNNVYTTQTELEAIVKDLAAFREHVHGGIYDIHLGEFGPEYANGAFQARLHFHIPGTLFVSTYQQTDFKQFSVNEVASEAKFYLKTEPVLLDNFISELKKLNLGNGDEALLKCE